MDFRSKMQSALKQTFLYGLYKPVALALWKYRGKPIPPPSAMKHNLVKVYARKHKLEVFVETGTYLGDMINAMRWHFKKLYSIELQADLAQRAQQRFASHPYVTILYGDSGAKIQEVLATLDEPALFWLDAHYSGGFTARGDIDTPILGELKHILSHHVQGHILLIDDARCFGDDGHYPTLDEIRIICSIHDKVLVDVSDDIIRVIL